MIDLKRAALAAPVLALTLVCTPAGMEAQAPRQQPGRPAAAPATLPAARARPPASRRPAAQPAPARPAAARPVASRPAVTPAAVPAPAAAPTEVRPNGETWNQISAEAVNAGRPALPVGRGHLGPSVLRVQVLLDRALFSPGMIDGRWGKNTQNALYWLQAREGLPATGVADSATFAKLLQLAGNPSALVRAHALTPDDVRGPFVQIPADIYQHAKLTCSCYESLTEKLTETFHASAGLLQKLNPGVRLDSLSAGDTLLVPNVRDAGATAPGEVRTLLVSGTDNYLQALDAGGRILYHFPTTLGSTFDPSPEGDFSVRSVHENPWWRYQPKILAHVPDWKPEASIPPGPNNAVGRVWMALSAPHYGIHGTKSPETIGYATSAGCVRLTNWDVLFLSKRVPPGTPVQFHATRTKPAAPAARPGAPARPAPAVIGVRADSARADSAKPAPAARPDSARRDSVRRDSAAPKPAPRDTAAAARRDSAAPTPVRRDSTPPAPARRDTAAARPTPPAQAAPAAPAPAPAPKPAARDTARRDTARATP